MQWCLDEGDVLALHDAASLWVPDSVRFTLLAIATHPPFPGRGVELPGVLDVQECSGSDDAKVRKVNFLSVKHLERLLHIERLVLSPVLEVRSRHEQLPPNRRWEAAVCEHASNRGAQSPPLTHSDTTIWCGVLVAVNSKANFPAVNHLERRLHLERLVLSLVLEVGNRHEQLPPNRQWKAAVCEHASNHGVQSPPPRMRTHRFGAACWWL